jgi:hypothetical protein
MAAIRPGELACAACLAGTSVRISVRLTGIYHPAYLELQRKQYVGLIVGLITYCGLLQRLESERVYF